MGNTCSHPGCPRPGHPTRCEWHTGPRVCRAPGCTTRAVFGYETLAYCAAHRSSHMKDQANPSCVHEGCTRRAVFGASKESGPRTCKAHSEPGARDVVNRTCSHDGCTRQPSFGLEGHRAQFCRAHSAHGMVNVVSRRCAHEGCLKQVRGVFCKGHRETSLIH